MYVPCSKHHPQEETDAPEEEVDMGKEWPSHENWDVKSYRQFYQSWCGVVQGAYPVEKEVAIKASPFLAITFFPSLVPPPHLFFINPSFFPFHFHFTSPLFPQTLTLLPASTACSSQLYSHTSTLGTELGTKHGRQRTMSKIPHSRPHSAVLLPYMIFSAYSFTSNAHI